jgi:predicted GTPase
MNNIVAIVGRPNVEINPFNRLIQREAIVDSVSGLPEIETMVKAVERKNFLY